MNNQFFLCQQQGPQDKSFFGLNLNEIEAFWFYAKTENAEASMTINFSNDRVEIQGADAERLLAMMNLRQPPEEKAQKADNSLDREFVRN